MNLYFIIILSTVVLKFLIDCIAECLNLRSLTPEVPSGFADLYDAEKYRQAQEYTRVKTRFGFIQSIFNLAVFLTFWFTGGFNWLDTRVRGWNHGPILSGILYIGILVIAGEVLSLPFAIYSTFIIEEKFGFNRTTPRTFVADIAKGLILQAAIGGSLLALVLWLFQSAGSGAWVYCWIATSLLMMLLQYLSPILILPLFNKFTPLQEGELRNAIEDYARSVNFS